MDEESRTEILESLSVRIQNVHNLMQSIIDEFNLIKALHRRLAAEGKD